MGCEREIVQRLHERKVEGREEIKFKDIEWEGKDAIYQGMRYSDIHQSDKEWLKDRSPLYLSDLRSMAATVYPED